MKLSTKGIAWLIFGVLVIISSFESYGWANKLSTMGIGVTFALVYVMKQFFKPRLYGLFIAGGILLSFCIYNGINEELVMPFAIAAGCMGGFYLLNKKPVDEIMDGVESFGDDEIENFDYVAPETYEETPNEGEASATESGGYSGSPDGGTSDSSDSWSSDDPTGGPSDNEEDGVIEIEATVPAPKAKTKAAALETKTEATPRAETEVAPEAKTDAAPNAKPKATAAETKTVEFDLDS